MNFQCDGHTISLIDSLNSMSSKSSQLAMLCQLLTLVVCLFKYFFLEILAAPNIE